MSAPTQNSAALITTSRNALHAHLAASALFAWHHKVKSGNEIRVPSIADADNRDSIGIASEVFKLLGIDRNHTALSPQKAGSDFEAACTTFMQDTFAALAHIRPGQWEISPLSSRKRLEIARFEQYSHLSEVAAACEGSDQLAAALGRDYLIAPDIVVIRNPEPDSTINVGGKTVVDEITARRTSLRAANGARPFLHASISCKLTMRSDRAQNSRAEALNLIRNRKGRVPHIAVVTAEPLPSRLSSLALGTGDLDCVYHIALPELIAAVNSAAGDDSRESLRIMVEGKRLRDISDLPLDLAV
jgi:hypothetical protein